MPLRVIKIILPENFRKQALELLESQDNLNFWQEESSGGNFVVSALTDSGRTETIMDLFEKRYASVEGFMLILLPVEASIPRTDILIMLNLGRITTKPKKSRQSQLESVVKSFIQI